MKKRYIAFAAVTAAVGTYLGAICPRMKARPNMSAFDGKVFAHRGMFGGDNPENSLGAFAKAVENGYGIELDVQISSDGEAMVFHDASLLRMYGENKAVDSLTADELKEYGIPTLREALEIIDGKVPVIVELKGEGRDISIAPITAEVLDEYNGDYCVESFNPFIIKWFKDCRPDVIRGQLSGSHLTEGKKSIKFFMLENLMFNFISRPDFIAYDHKSRAKISLALCRKLFDIPVIAWTIKTSEEWSACADKFDAYICEGLPKKRAQNK